MKSKNFATNGHRRSMASIAEKIYDDYQRIAITTTSMKIFRPTTKRGESGEQIVMQIAS